MQAIILAAGKSTRTYPLTLDIPKGLLRICNKPILEWTLAAVAPLTDEIIIVVGYKKEMIMQSIGESFQGVPVRYVTQAKQDGTGGAVKLCREFLTGDFMVLYGDDMYSPHDVATIANETGNALLAAPVDDIATMGAVITDENNNFIKIIEKSADVKTNLANTGCMRLTRDVFAYELPLTTRGEYELTDYVSYAGERYGVKVSAVRDYWKPIGYPWDVYNVNFWMKQKILPTENIIGANVSISPEATLENCIIEDGARIESDCHLTNCIIMQNCTVTKKTTLQNAIISPKCDIVVHR